MLFLEHVIPLYVIKSVCESSRTDVNLTN